MFEVVCRLQKAGDPGWVIHPNSILITVPQWDHREGSSSLFAQASQLSQALWCTSVFHGHVFSRWVAILPPPHSGDNDNVWGYYRLWQVEEREEDAVCIWWGGAREREEDGVCIWWVGARGPRSKYCILHVTVSCNSHLSPNINTDTLAKPSSQTQWWQAGLSGISFHSLQTFLTFGCARQPTNMLRSVVWGWRQDSPCPQRTSSFVGSPRGSLKKETCAFKRLLFT